LFQPFLSSIRPLITAWNNGHGEEKIEGKILQLLVGSAKKTRNHQGVIYNWQRYTGKQSHSRRNLPSLKGKGWKKLIFMENAENSGQRRS